MAATRPCPQCRQTARLRDETLVWACMSGHRFMSARPSVIEDGCAELVAVEGKKKRERCRREFEPVGAFVVCRRHPTTCLWRNDGSSPLGVDAAGRLVMDRILASFCDEPVLWPGPQDGEVPFGMSEEEWLAIRPGWEAAHPGRAPKPELFVEPVPDVTPDAETVPVAATTVTVDEPRLPLDVAVVPPKVRKKIPALSPSSTSVLAQCPRRFELTKVLGWQEPTSKPAVVGKFIHKVLEWMADRPVDDRTEDTVRVLAALLWEAMLGVDGDPLPHGVPESDEDDVNELRRDRLAIGVTEPPEVKVFKGQAWAAFKYAVSIEHDYGGEVAHREVDVKDTKVNGVPFRGYVDRVDRHYQAGESSLVIVDYKSGKAPVDEWRGGIDQRKLDEKSEQLLWYWPAVEQVTGEKVSGALLAYIGAGAQQLLWCDDRRRGAAEDKIARLWNALQSWERAATSRGEPYPTDPSFLCGWCPFWETCRDGSAFLLDNLGWADARPGKGKPAPPFRVEMFGPGWSEERRNRWREFARG